VPYIDMVNEFVIKTPCISILLFVVIIYIKYDVIFLVNQLLPNAFKITYAYRSNSF